MQTNKKTFAGSLLLLITSMIWGFAFVAQKAAVDHLGPFAITCLRSFIAAPVLIPVIMLMDRLRGNGRRLFSRRALDITPVEWRGGILSGTALGIASVLQQFGLTYNGSSGKTAFITAIYVALVPVFGFFVGRRTTLPVWCGVAGSIFGAYLLAVPAGEGLVPNAGDLLVLLCAAVFAVQILTIDRFSPRSDGVRMAAVQFLTCGTVCLPFMLFLEQPAPAAILACVGPILFLGILSSGVAYTLQIVAQKTTPPAVASVIMCLESVFGLLGGAVVYGETLTSREWIGCGVLLLSVIAAELAAVFRPAKEANETKENETKGEEA